MFKVLNRRLVCENLRFRIFFDTVETKEGQVIPNYLVVLPKSDHPTGLTGSAILPVWRGKFGIIQMYRHAIGRYVWEIPKGFSESGETPAQTASRELEEETGLSCGESELIPLGAVVPEGSTIGGTICLFAAKCDGDPPPHTLCEDGHRKLEFISEDQYAARARNSEIEDPASLISFYRYREIRSHSSK